MKKGLHDFHSKYVFVPADKASNNVIIVWRLHYVDVLNQELVNTKSYTSTTLSEQDLVAGHLEKCAQLRADININCRKLPTIYWIPKLHKTPYKARLIANTSSCTTTHIYKILTSCLIKIKEHVQRSTLLWQSLRKFLDQLVLVY